VGGGAPDWVGRIASSLIGLFVNSKKILILVIFEY